MSKPIALITGVSGYVGAHCCKLFLDDGSYAVRGTVRSTKNPAKMDPLKKAFGDKFDEIEFVEADLTDKESLIRACEGVTYVIHVASPVPDMKKKQTADELIRPAVDGTLAIMEGALQSKTVKRVVITSSLAAMHATKNYK